MNTLPAIMFIGIGATVTMDLWGVLRKPLIGVPPPNYGLVGRWIAHMMHAQFHHKAIAASPSVRGERITGWTVHYLTGIAFAAILIGIWGHGWIQHPTLGPALIVGLSTTVAPFLLMQPGMGAGIAASRTPRPASGRLQTLLTHTVFGLGLYASGQLLQLFHTS